jgi:hypothetical protein
LHKSKANTKSNHSNYDTETENNTNAESNTNAVSDMGIKFDFISDAEAKINIQMTSTELDVSNLKQFYSSEKVC